MTAESRFTAADHAWMARALRLARRGLWTTRPNPRVGCVLVRDGSVVGEGWHARAGEAHAEVLALRDAGERAAGATAYVNLEPCSHHGRTPPCAVALAQAGVSRVVAGMVDPNPRVSGRGLAMLRDAGVEVAAGVAEAACRELNAGFARRMEQGRPYVRVKLAASLDGHTAMASGESRWITGAPARADVHRLRARSCAVVTGIGTVLADDPALTVRDVAEPEAVPPPRRVVVDRALRTPPASRLFAGAGAVSVLGCSGAPERRGALEAAGAEVAVAPAFAQPAGVLDWLGARDVNEVLVEAGPTLAGAFLAAGCVDELVLYQAPHFMGGAARPLLDLPGLDAMAQRIPLRVTEVRHVGADLRLTVRPEPDRHEGD